MQVGIIGGTGPAGRALGTRLAAGGAEVILGSRSAERGEEVALEAKALFPDRELHLVGAANELAAQSEIVVLATPWEGALVTALELSDALAGRVVVSMVNALTRVGKEFHALVPVRGSIAATLQALLVRSQVTAAFQHLPARELGAIDQELVADVFICADDEEAGAQTAALVSLMPGLRPILAGSLASANAVEALTAVLLNINVRYRAHVAPRLIGLPG
jgi:NADPH-dependent F420 reductase